MRAAEVAVDAGRMGVGPRAGAAHRDRARCRSPRSAARRRLPPTAAAPGSLAAVLDARRALLDAELALIQQQQAAAKAWAWLHFVVPATEGS